MPKTKPGANLPSGIVIRQYRPGSDDAEIMRLQDDANQEWKNAGGGVLFTPGLPPDPACSIVVEKDGKLILMGGGRVVLEIGCRIDAKAFSSQAELRDVILNGWAKLLAQAMRAGYTRMVCSVTSPTPKWKNFLKKRLGFGGYGAEMLHLNLPDAIKSEDI